MGIISEPSEPSEEPDRGNEMLLPTFSGSSAPLADREPSKPLLCCLGDGTTE